MIKFSIIINKWAIFYFFVQNLSEWHFSNRKSYNILWQKELGKFSIQEKKALSEFKKIHLRYPFGKSYLGRQFFLKKNPWIVLKEKLPQKDFTNLKNCFSDLEKQFYIFYNKEIFLLNKWQTTLQRRLNVKKLTTIINKNLSKLYSASPISGTINIYILPSTKNHTGGMGGVVNDKSILLEISRLPINKINYAIGIIWHEILHLSHFGKYKIFHILDQKFQNNRKMWKLVEEAIVSSLFPNGILGIKFLKNNKKLLNANLSREHTDQLIKLSNTYYKNNKAFDEQYIEKIHALFYTIK